MNSGLNGIDSFFSEVENLFSEAFSDFPQVAPDWSRTWTLSSMPGFTVGVTAKSKLPNCIVSSAYPPSNVFFDKDKNYRVQIACAGYDESAVEMEFDDPSLVVSFNGDSPFEASPCMLQSGVKKLDKEFKISFAIDSRKFDIDKLTFTMKNGLLDITIPAIPKKKFKVGGSSAKDTSTEDASAKGDAKASD